MTKSDSGPRRLKKGSVVVSLSGKDKDSLLAVLAVVDTEEGRVLVADGKHRPVERPKKKNPLHVRDTGQLLAEDTMATNRAIRRALAELYSVELH